MLMALTLIIATKSLKMLKFYITQFNKRSPYCCNSNTTERWASSVTGSKLKNERPTWCHLLFYFTSYVLNMFRTLIYPSSGACDCVDELPHLSSCYQFVVCWIFGAAPKLQHTTNWEQDDRCGNSSTQSQAPDDGYINVRNMLST